MYDLIVIGGGPAGYHAAYLAGRAGLKTLLMEKNEVGGVCLNEGCIPTKTLAYSAKLKDGAENGKRYGVIAETVKLDHKAVLARKNKVVKVLVSGVKAQLKAAGVETISGEAYIVGKDDGFSVRCGSQQADAKRLLIATGSAAVTPPIPGLKEALSSGFAITSKEALELQSVPERLVVIGGGVVGLELAGYFASAGADVSVIEMLETIGGGLSADIANILKRNLEKRMRVYTGRRVTDINADSVTFEDASGIKQAQRGLVLVCAGRRAAAEGLGLENIGVRVEKGAVLTDASMRTNVTGLWAAGDVNGKSMLAHTAYREAEVAVHDMLGIEDAMDYSAVPGVIFTNPEVAWVGETELSAAAKGISVTAKTVSMRFSGRYVAENEGGDGIAKLVCDESGRILGFDMIANHASEIIYGAGMMVAQGMTLEQVTHTVFPHPTVSEIIKECAFQAGERE
jgi:dihydrolipoamide dehydrogenase